MLSLDNHLDEEELTNTLLDSANDELLSLQAPL